VFNVYSEKKFFQLSAALLIESLVLAKVQYIIIKFHLLLFSCLFNL